MFCVIKHGQKGSNKADACGSAPDTETKGPDEKDGRKAKKDTRKAKKEGAERILTLILAR